ncbi:hypothetical protein KKB71_00705 [Patescibacteria group bacterium]|nr:hypothetical protein [Patescibacteria group bacterium]MBU2219331.1 hypothetical protein [Patescibacteria group bacterium]MBU2263410.1 hypothetical protein [Patescibacteria group bacterium]
MKTCTALVREETAPLENIHEYACGKIAWYRGIKSGRYPLYLCVKHGREYRDQYGYTLEEISPD